MCAGPDLKVCLMKSIHKTDQPVSFFHEGNLSFQFQLVFSISNPSFQFPNTAAPPPKSFFSAGRAAPRRGAHRARTGAGADRAGGHVVVCVSTRFSWGSCTKVKRARDRVSERARGRKGEREREREGGGRGRGREGEREPDYQPL